jgi:probable phosphoglycerate mutase
MPMTEPRIEIGLLRHFPTLWNAEGRLQGRTDIPLSPEGRAELARHRLPARWRGCPVLTSPLSRATETAQALAEAARPLPDQRLVEMSFGDWEGQVGESLQADPASGYRPLEAWGWDFTAPNGESPRAMLARVLPVLSGCTRPTLVVCHRGVIRAVLAAATGWGYSGAMPFRIRKAHIHPVFLSADGALVGIGTPERLDKR